ncbi:MAG: PAS domain S-box protein [bacterium]|nr:PAS domain S-box protein [bacterium]
MKKSRSLYSGIIGRLILMASLVCTAGIFSTIAASPLILSPGSTDSYNLSHEVYFFKDKTNGLTIKNIRRPEVSSRFILNRETTPNFGYTSSTIWSRFHIQSASSKEQEWILTTGHPRLDTVELYIFDSEELISIKKTGDLLPFKERDIEHQNFCFRIEIKPGQTLSCYLRIRSNTSIQVPLVLRTPVAFSEFATGEMYLFGIALGILVVLLLFSLFSFVSVKDRSYFFYILYIISFTLYLTSLDGIAYRFLWPQLPWMSNHGIIIFCFSSFFWGILFGQSFLNTRKNTPVLHKLLNLFLYITAGLIPLTIFIQHPVSSFPAAFSGIIIPPFLFIAAIKTWKQGFRAARFYMLAWTGTLFGTLIIAGKFLEILPANAFTGNIYHVGQLISNILFLLALVDRINIIKQEKEEALNLQLEESRKVAKLTRKYQSIFENAVEGIFQVGPSGAVMDANPALAKIFGYDSAEELISTFTNISEFTFVNKNEQELLLKKVREYGHIAGFEGEIFTKNRTIIDAYISVHTVYDHEGSILYYEGALMDITDRKQVEKELLNQKIFTEVIINSLPGVFYVFEKDGRLIKWNKKLASLSGYSHDELSRMNLFDWFKGEDLEKMKNLLPRLFKTDEADTTTNVLLKDGSTVPYLLTGARLKRDDTEYFAGMGVDITELKKVEKELRNHRDNLEELVEARTEELRASKEAADTANQAKSEFLANMSHELRTPLNAVIGFCELLSSRISEPKEKSYLTSIRTAGKSLLTLINDILDLSKIEAGKIEIRPGPVRLQDIFEEIGQIFKEKLLRKDIEFETFIDNELTQPLLLDETRLRQVLLNLVGNAVKFTEEGSVRLEARKKETTPGDKNITLEILINDTGIGIPEDEHECIFESFKQQPGQSIKKYGGTGLGLTISKRLIEIMNGEITLQSAAGKGSTFTITLRDIAISTTSLPAVQEDGFTLENITFSKAKVLVVDDVLSNRDMICELLSRVNLDTAIAENGKDALSMVEKFQPQIILMDIMMPEMDGYESTQKIKANKKYANIPVIALTAAVKQKTEDEMKTLGFSGYLAKPVVANLIFKELAKFLDYSRKKQAKEPFPKEHPLVIPPESIPHTPKLLKILEDEMMPKFEFIKGGMQMDEIKRFAHALKETGEEFGINKIIEFAEQLNEFEQSFDIIGIKKTLAEFPSLVKEFREYQEK